MKRCSMCQQALPDSRFYRNPRARDHLSYSCKDCERLRLAERWKDVPEHERQRRRDYFNEVYYPRQRAHVIRRVIENQKRARKERA